MGSNHRRLSRRFYSPILLFEAYAAYLTLWGTGLQAGPPFLLSLVSYVAGDMRAREGGPRCLSTSESTSTASVPGWR